MIVPAAARPAILARMPRAAALVVLLACGPPPSASPAPAPDTPPPPAPAPAPAKLPAIAITIDDLVVGGRDLERPRLDVMTDQIIKHIVDGRAPTVAFVNSAKLHDGAEKAARVEILRRWTAAGIELGNHTHAHPSLQTTPLAEFEADVLRGEPEIRALNAEKGWPLRWFRHPYLRTGPTRAVRAEFEEFLADHHYTVAPVTVDNSDWLFNFVYTDAKTRGDADLMRRVGEAFLANMDEVLTFHEQATEALFHRKIDHVLLLHANELAAEYLDDVIALYRRRGYRFASLEEVLADEAYREPDEFAGDAGISWLHRWDLTRGRKQVDWSAEPPVPDWLQAEFEKAQRG